MMEFCINASALRQALFDIEQAEKAGFQHCLAVFRMIMVGHLISSNQAGYSDLLERAHPTDGNLDWGRFQGVSKRNTFTNGKLVPNKGES